jgi:UDP-N-acetylmuramoyl-tripeptide--D-alanyl-D-alanine ligase
LNLDEPKFTKIKDYKQAFVVTYGITNKCDFKARAVKLTSRRTIEFNVNSINRCKMKLNTVGYANVYNALAAIAVARVFGWDYASISKRLAAFVFRPGRMKLIKLNNVPFIDDTYNANPVSLSEALRVLQECGVRGRRIFIMGDMLELGKSSERFHRQAGIQIARACDAFISVGKLAQISAQSAVKLGLSRKRVFSCPDSRQAGNLLFKTIKPDSRDLILVKGSRLMKMEEIFKVKD